MADFVKSSKTSKQPFYQIPKQLFTNEQYAEVSVDAKLLYGILLDRMSLSAKNKWHNENGTVYIFFTVEQVCKLLHFGKSKVCKLFSELDNTGLISRKRQGNGKANIIYPKLLL